MRDLSRIRKQSGGLFSRRKWEVLKKAAQFFAAQGREVSVHCQLSGQPFAQPSLSHDGRNGSRVARVAAQAPSIRQRRDMVILAHIREQHRLSLGSYGRPRMTEELNELGLRVGQRRVGRLMRQNGIRIIRSQLSSSAPPNSSVTKSVQGTDFSENDHAFNIAPNLLQQDFSASAPNQKWAGDITYIWTREGWVYLAVIIDLFSRRVIGWAVSTRMKQDLAIRALNMAVALRRPPPGCIHHTDRGAQTLRP